MYVYKILQNFWKSLSAIKVQTLTCYLLQISPPPFLIDKKHCYVPINTEQNLGVFGSSFFVHLFLHDLTL